MRGIIQEFKDITNSRELLEAKPSPFIAIFIYILIAILLITTIWAYYGEVDIPIKATGVVRPEKKISRIRNKVAGKIIAIYYEEGKKTTKDQVLYKVETTIFEVEKKALMAENTKLKSNLADLIILKKCVKEQIKAKDSKELFSEENNEYYYRYLDYLSSTSKMAGSVRQKKEIYETLNKLYRLGAVSYNDLINVKNDYTNVKMDLEIYNNKYLLEVQSDIANTEKSILSLEKKIQNVDLNIKDAVVKAPIAGIINVINVFNKGDLIEHGTEMVTILPKGDDYFRIQIAIPNAEIANVKVGQKIKYHFAALPFKEYGELTGVLQKIGIDAKAGKKQNTSYYIAEATVENKPLFNHKGEKAWIKVGMQCEARIITKSKKILFFLLEKIDLRD